MAQHRHPFPTPVFPGGRSRGRAETTVRSAESALVEGGSGGQAGLFGASERLIQVFAILTYCIITLIG